MGVYQGELRRPRQDSNLRTRLRRPVLYPLSYGGIPHGGYPRSGLVAGPVSGHARGAKRS